MSVFVSIILVLSLSLTATTLVSASGTGIIWPSPPTSVMIAPVLPLTLVVNGFGSTVYLETGLTQQFTATITCADGSKILTLPDGTCLVIVASSLPAADNYGGYRGQYIAGTTYNTGDVVTYSGVYYICTTAAVVIIAPSTDTITWIPITPTIISAANNPITWTSSNTFATITSAGLVTGKAPNESVIISASINGTTLNSSGGSTASNLQILPPAIGSVSSQTTNFGNVILIAGQPFTITAAITVTDLINPILGYAVSNWSSTEVTGLTITSITAIGSTTGTQMEGPNLTQGNSETVTFTVKGVTSATLAVGSTINLSTLTFTLIPVG